MVRRAIWFVLLWLGVVAPALAEPPHGATLDSRMYGMWMLDPARNTSDGPYPTPKAGLVNWTEHGMVFAITLADGSLYADATVFDDHGCIMVGVPKTYRCEVDIVTPTHVHLIVRRGQTIEREGDIELVDNDTQRTVHKVTPEHGEPYTETTVWTRTPD